jgi:hypothetical protein
MPRDLCRPDPTLRGAAREEAGIQLLPDLEPDVEAALRASIDRFGVIIPIVRDQHGRILDGNHRARIAADLGVGCDEIIVKVADDAEAREYARTLNADRRHLTPDQRREVVGTLREQGHSLRAIAGAVRVSEPTVRRDVEKAIASGDAIAPERVTRQGGGTYPAKRPAAVVPHIESPAEARGPHFSLAVQTTGRLADLLDGIEHLDQPEIMAGVLPTRRASTAKRLRKVGMILGRIACQLERLAEPTPEEVRAKREAEEAARPEKAKHELELARADLDRVTALYPDRNNQEKTAAQHRVQKAEDEVLYLQRQAEDRARRAARETSA